jgi:hypothetical protein
MTVQRDVVVKKLADLNVQGDEEGLIPGFNVLVNNLPVAFWNTFTTRMIEATPEEQHEEMKEELVNCALECGYNTGYGIVTSDIFQSTVGPMITDGEKDVLRGAYAVFTAWGWAKSGIAQIKPGERMVVRAQDYYEADDKTGYLNAFMIRGVSSAFFDLAYGEAYPNGMKTFKCEQTKGMEVGDPFGEFVVTKA